MMAAFSGVANAMTQNMHRNILETSGRTPIVRLNGLAPEPAMQAFNEKFATGAFSPLPKWLPQRPS